MKKVCVVTGTRAEYGLLYWLLKGLNNSEDFDLRICATGMHLSPEFGLTYQQIINDGFKLDGKVETLLSSDSTESIAKSIGIGMIGFSQYFSKCQPDLLLILGDRYDILPSAVAAMIMRIPIAHCHGGEATEGLIDEPIRHSITKMSHIHFTSNDIYMKRVIQLGENPDNVYNVGALGIENVNKLELYSKQDFENSINFKLFKMNFIVTFHPVTLENDTSKSQFTELLKALDFFKDVSIIFTMPNSDSDGRIVMSLINRFVKKNNSRAIAFKSLGQLKYLSALKNSDIVIGNSSSGLIEAPSFKIPTINIGDRQRGRVKGSTVINCDPKRDKIIDAINKGLSANFKLKCKKSDNPYGTGNSSSKIIKILEKQNLDKIIKKPFYNLK